MLLFHSLGGLLSYTFPLPWLIIILGLRPQTTPGAAWQLRLLCLYMDDETNIWLVAGNVDIMVGHELFLAFELAIDRWSPYCWLIGDDHL